MFESLYALHRDGRLPDEHDARGGRAAGDQGDRQGPAEDPLQDGHLHDPLLHRRADLRGRRRRTGRSSTATSPAPPRASAASAWTRSPREALDRHARAYPAAESRSCCRAGGIYAWRRARRVPRLEPGDDRARSSTPPAARAAPEAYERFATYVNEVAVRNAALRGLLRFRDDVEPVPLDEVEPATEIVKRFKSGGMCLGALSPEAHETLAVGMNRLGGKSNTGEGGEDPAPLRRRAPLVDQAGGLGPLRRDRRTTWSTPTSCRSRSPRAPSRARAASCPGHKVDRYIAGLRHSTPGVALISPPPHHDIYSIEDLKQLIYDLRCANPRARGVGEAGVRGGRRAPSRRAWPRPTPTTS